MGCTVAVLACSARRIESDRPADFRARMPQPEATSTKSAVRKENFLVDDPAETSQARLLPDRRPLRDSAEEVLGVRGRDPGRELGEQRLQIFGGPRRCNDDDRLFAGPGVEHEPAIAVGEPVAMAAAERVALRGEA